MAEYIKREDAIKIAEKYGLANGSVLGRHTRLADYIASEIAAIPTADVVPAKRARWMPKAECGYPNRIAECSRCGYEMPYPGETYCPNCGAEMDEEDENDQSND